MYGILREFWREGERLIPIFERAVEAQKVWGLLQQMEPSTAIADAYESEAAPLLEAISSFAEHVNIIGEPLEIRR